MASAQGSQIKAAYDLDDVDANSLALELVSESLSAEHTLVESDGIRGTRSRTKERVRRGLINVGGELVMHPSPTELDALLYPISGTAGTTTGVFALAETVPEFDIMIDKVTKVFDYTDLKVNRATFRSSPGRPLELALDVIGKTQVIGNAGTFPALTFDTDTMYVFTDSVFTYNSTAYDIMDFELVIDNLVVPRFTNSTTATDVAATDRRVTLAVTTPWTSSEVALYDTTSVAGAAATLVLTNGGQSLSFAFANLKLNPARTPVVNGRGEIVQQLTFNSYKSATTKELIITHDSTA
ncbi:MAG TPA: phage tail tube protein [Planctomycetaceae bacterium]|nr:phage tail tube protein [Planctomycetaceae bacterium]